MIAVGVYGTEALQSLRFATARLLVAISLGVIFLSFIAFVRPGATLWRSNSLYAMTFAFLLLIFLRILLGRSEEHTSELQSLMRHLYAVFCLNKKGQHGSVG